MDRVGLGGSGFSETNKTHATQHNTTTSRFWRRYIYLWINYALFEELQAADAERTREVYKCVPVHIHALCLRFCGLCD